MTDGSSHESRQEQIPDAPAFSVQTHNLLGLTDPRPGGSLGASCPDISLWTCLRCHAFQYVSVIPATCDNTYLGMFLSLGDKKSFHLCSILQRGASSSSRGQCDKVQQRVSSWPGVWSTCSLPGPCDLLCTRAKSWISGYSNTTGWEVTQVKDWWWTFQLKLHTFFFVPFIHLPSFLPAYYTLLCFFTIFPPIALCLFLPRWNIPLFSIDCPL